ncbi:putative ataxin-10, partial [Apostichopus japonicus]
MSASMKSKHDLVYKVEMSSQQHILESLQQLTLKMKQTENRWSSDDELEDVILTLSKTFTCMQHSQPSPYELKLCLESLRCLRNACAGCRKNQDLLISRKVPELLCKLISAATHDAAQTESPEEDVLTLLRCSIQACCEYGHRQQPRTAMYMGHPIPWICYYSRDYGTSCTQDLLYDVNQRHLEMLYSGPLTGVLTCDDTKAQHYGCMLVLACLKSPQILATFETSNERIRLSEAVLTICTKETELDFSLQLVTFLLQQSYFIPDSLVNLSSDARMTLLDIISAHLSEEDEDSDSRSIIDEKALKSLAEIFEKDCHHVIKFAAGGKKKRTQILRYPLSSPSFSQPFVLPLHLHPNQHYQFFRQKVNSYIQS